MMQGEFFEVSKKRIRQGLRYLNWKPVSGVILWLCLIILLGNGCASTSGSLSVGSSAEEGRQRLPFPGARRQAPVGTNGIANVVSYDDYRDPLSGLNRITFACNNVLYRFLLIPIADSYLWVMPDPLERRVHNVFENIKTPLYAVNHLLQFKLKASGRSLLRFGANSTIGVLGVFDPARAWFDIKPEETHLEDTFSRYGAGYGLYLVLPIFGPSDVRNSFSTVGEYFLNPIPFVTDDPATIIIQGTDNLQDFAPSADQYNILRVKSDDPYIFFRNLYLQGVQRDAEY